MVETLDRLIGDAAAQHGRLSTALASSDAESLGFSSAQAAALSSPLQLEVIVTLDEVTTWATQAHELQNLEILPSDRLVPWILSLTDLMAVVDLLDNAQLAHYLIRRQLLERDGRVEAHDELDWVGHYIAEGLYFGSFFESDDAPSLVRLLSYTEPIDSWYFARSGDRAVPTAKPEQPLPHGLRRLLRRLESERPEHWLLACVALLDGDTESRQLWSEAVEHVGRRVAIEGWSNTSQVFQGSTWCHPLRGPSRLFDCYTPCGPVIRLVEGLGTGRKELDCDR
jgi:hypothetical protein